MIQDILLPILLNRKDSVTKLGETVHFDVTTHSASGQHAKSADEVPKFWVFEEDDDTPIISSSGMTLRTGFIGLYRGKFEATTVNGFEAGKYYDVMVSGKMENVWAQIIALHFYVEANSFDTLPTATGIWAVNGRIASGVPVYYADIKYVRDALGTLDEYTTQWYRNDIPCSSGDITSPTIQVIKRADGTDLVASTSMDFISLNIGTVKYTQATAVVVGEGYIIKNTATIDGQTRTWQRIIGRDSSA